MAETETPLTREEITARRERRRHWYGYLADENVRHVAARIERLLDGRRYTFVHNNVAQPRTAPDVRTSQKVVDPIRVYRIGDSSQWSDDGLSSFAGLSVHDTYGVWGVNTSHQTEAEARKDEKYATYLSIEGGHGDPGDRDFIEIHQHNGYGEMLHWVIAVEVGESA